MTAIICSQHTPSTMASMFWQCLSILSIPAAWPWQWPWQGDHEGNHVPRVWSHKSPQSHWHIPEPALARHRHPHQCCHGLLVTLVLHFSQLLAAVDTTVAVEISIHLVLPLLCSIRQAPLPLPPPIPDLLLKLVVFVQHRGHYTPATITATTVLS